LQRLRSCRNGIGPGAVNDHAICPTLDANAPAVGSSPGR
jgi:hypothetical protein